MPCTQRVKDLLSKEEFAEEREVEGDWVDTSYKGSKANPKVPEIVDINLEEQKEVKKQQEPANAKGTEKIMDINDMEEDNNVFEEIKHSDAKESETIDVRRYDISITYDFYYQTPSLFLFGYNEKQAPLTADEMFEDIMDDYANKTATIKPHPHQGINSISIHPCRHAEVMKKIIDTIAENGGKAEVRHAMFVFLKFISSVVPTLEYDYTVDLDLE